MDSVEIVVRVAGVFSEVRQLAHGRSFRVGTAAGVDLPIEMPSFTIVRSTESGYVVCCPHAGTHEHLAPGARIELGFGEITITISRIPHVRGPLRLRAPYTPRLFGTAALALYLVMLIAALAFYDYREPERPFHGPPSRIIRLLPQQHFS